MHWGGSVIRLRIASLDSVNRAFQDAAGLVERGRTEGAEAALGAYIDAVKETFASEGAFLGNSWQPLAQRTQRERGMLGYGPSHPILRREGYLLDSLTDPGFPGPQTIVVRHLTDDETHISGNVVQEVRQGGDYLFRFGTMDDRFAELHFGSSTIPARPMVPGDDPRVTREMERLVVERLKDA